MSPNEVHLEAGDRRALDERLHRLSHDLKNRIGSALEALRGLREPANGLSPADLHDFAERNLFQAMHTLERALDDLGVARGPGAVALQPVDLAQVARAAADRCTSRYARKQQSLAIDLPDRLPVHGDAELLVELVHALLTNASKFAPAGSEVHLQAADRDRQAVLSVSDRGAGLAADDLERVFQRYAWLSSRPTAGEGQARSTLARAHQWAHAHGGLLEARSDGPGAGCTFTLALPLSSRG
ncbi:MAG: HAMP domain-containing histidine kinase [Flavobacteriales bacterium]|nr:Signal-transduction histidine kinase senX3 [Flavobacteriales bacterium]MCC6576226.1 HAMP domain-containing histidine kinase [Flavobacteriales bacterium]NUQ14992.1 HAMP domain-containing histidine kinase [Flavobacteriales bacterium]